MTDDDISSPCINVCVIDAHSGLCSGCRRTLDEIARWQSYSPAEKLAVLERTIRRKATAHD